MIHLTIVTAESTTYDGDVLSLVVPAVDGEIGILTNHHPIVTKLGPGGIKIIKADQSEELLFTSGGYLEVNNNKAVILANMAEDVGRIQKDEAVAARKRAAEMLKLATDEVEREKLEAELRTQMMRERMADIAEYSKRK